MDNVQATVSIVGGFLAIGIPLARACYLLAKNIEDYKALKLAVESLAKDRLADHEALSEHKIILAVNGSKYEALTQSISEVKIEMAGIRKSMSDLIALLSPRDR